MPPAIAAAGIGAATTLGGALIGRSGQNRAIQSQERAAQQQIQLERERDAQRAARYERAYGSYEREKAQYDQIRRGLLAHYGINFGDAGGGAPAGGGPAKGGMSLGDLVSRGGAPTAFGGAAPAAVPDVAGGPAAEPMAGSEDVFDWRNYGVAR